MEKPRHAGSTCSLLVTDRGKGHVFGKPGTTISPDASGELPLKAQNLAGYVKTKSGRTVAYALLVKKARPVHDIETDVSAVFEDEVASVICESI
jgi:D-alanyl-D-alanine carboxypeptidase